MRHRLDRARHFAVRTIRLSSLRKLAFGMTPDGRRLEGFRLRRRALFMTLVRVHPGLRAVVGAAAWAGARGGAILGTGVRRQLADTLIASFLIPVGFYVSRNGASRRSALAPQQRRCVARKENQMPNQGICKGARL